MFTIPISDNLAFVLDDDDFVRAERERLAGEDEFDVEENTKKSWRCHYVEFDTFAVESFATPGVGIVYSGTFNLDTHAAWVLSRDQLFLISRKTRKVGRAPPPEDRISLFDISRIGDRYYLSCNNSKMWFYDVVADKWIAAVTSPPPPPPRKAQETTPEYVARTTKPRVEHIRKYPHFYKAIAVGGDHYLLGALGRVVRLRGDASDELWLASGARLVRGGSEGDQAILCGDDPVAEIFRGTLDAGFERIYQNEERALHMTAIHNRVRYIGAAEFPGFNGPSLHTYDGENLTPIETGCAREPDNLLDLSSTGKVLWAIDRRGIFRLAGDDWTLTELSDIERGRAGLERARS